MLHSLLDYDHAHASCITLSRYIGVVRLYQKRISHPDYIRKNYAFRIDQLIELVEHFFSNCSSGLYLLGLYGNEEDEEPDEDWPSHNSRLAYVTCFLVICILLLF